MDKKHLHYYIKLGENIKFYRRQAHLTQEGLALKANISRGYLSQIEARNVEKVPSLDIIFRIAEVLKIPPCQLFKF